MKIISLVNSKGGVGKTTLCINLAIEMQKHLSSNPQILKNSFADIYKTALRYSMGEDIRNDLNKEPEYRDKYFHKKALIVDADPQGTARDWHEAGGHHLIDLIVLDRKQALNNLSKMDLDYDYIFIDTPGRISEISTTALIVSDMVLVPIQPSPYDIWAASDTIEVIKQRQEITEGPPIGRFILNRCIPNTNIEKEAKEYLHKSSFPHLETTICQRVVYAESGAQGKTVFEYKNQWAIDSIIELGDEIREVLENVD